MSKILLVGVGGMGSALLDAWEAIGQFNVLAVDPNPSGMSLARPNIYVSLEDLLVAQEDYQPDCIVFAVKPNMMSSAVPPYAHFQSPSCVYVSIAAGITFAFIKQFFDESTPCVRVMPNLGVLAQEGMTGLYSSDSLSSQQQALVTNLFQCSGKLIQVDSEDKIDAITAISGSGPGYVFRLIEAMIEGAHTLGFTDEEANELVFQTFKGALALLEKEPDPLMWRHRVTSPGGTTEAGLAVLKKINIDKVMTEVIQAAYDRAKELSL